MAIEQWVFIFYGMQLFMAPLSIAGSSIAAVLFLFTYVWSGFWKDWRAVLERPWFWPVLAMIGLNLAGILWTDDMAHGYYILSKLWYFLFLLLGAMLPWNRQRLRMLVLLFLIGLGLNALVGVLQWFGLYPWHPMVPDDGPVGYSYHVYLGLLLTAALLWILYDLRHQIVLRRPWALLLGGIFFLQLIMSPGRTGQLAFLLLFPAALLVLAAGRWRTWALGVALLGALILGLSPVVQQRFMAGVSDLTNYHQGNVMTSLGIRLVLWEGALEMAVEHPVLGVGTGGYRAEILRLQEESEIPRIPGLSENVIEPHNSYLAYLAEFGIVGLVILLWFLYALSRESWLARSTPEGWLRLSLLSTFLIGSLFDAFIWIWCIMIPLAVVSGVPSRQSAKTPAGVVEIPDLLVPAKP